MNTVRSKLWFDEVNRLLKVYNILITRFGFNLISCSSREIKFNNGIYDLYFMYSYDRHQIDRKMLMTLISFGDGEREKTIIEVLKRFYPEIDVYKEIAQLNSETNDQDVTYLKLLEKYIYILLESEKVFTSC